MSYDPDKMDPVEWLKQQAIEQGKVESLNVEKSFSECAAPLNVQILYNSLKDDPLYDKEEIKTLRDKRLNELSPNFTKPMLALTARGYDFHGIIGQPTGKFVGDLEVCVGDEVVVEPEERIHVGTKGVVGIFTDKFSVMGIAGTPISKLNVSSIIRSHTTLVEGDVVGREKDFQVKAMKI